ncbi:MAG: MATE family efflux transporter [Gemmatimonadales bacterium]
MRSLWIVNIANLILDPLLIFGIGPFPALGVATLVRLSGTGIFQILLTTTSWIGLVRVISSFGSQALAGYTVGIRVILFALLPSWGMANAAATMVGQSLGARKPERAERPGWCGSSRTTPPSCGTACTASAS